MDLIYNNFFADGTNKADYDEQIQQEQEGNTPVAANPAVIPPPVRSAPQPDYSNYTPSTANYLEQMNKYGIGDIEPYYNKQRESRIKAKQNANLVAQALSLIGQGVAGSQGMYISPNPEDQVMKQTNAELERMRELYDADVRRTRDMNMQKLMEALRVDYNNQQEDARWNRNMLFNQQQWDKEKAYREQEKADEREYQKERDKRLQEYDIAQIEKRGEYNASLREQEKAENKAAQDKTDEINGLINSFIRNIPDDPEARDAYFAGLPPSVRNKLEMGEALSKDEYSLIASQQKERVKNAQRQQEQIKKDTGNDPLNDGRDDTKPVLVYEVNGQRVTVSPEEEDQLKQTYPNAKKIQ